MAIKKTYRQYNNLFRQYEVKAEGSRKYLFLAKLFEVLQRIVALLATSFLAILIYAAMTEKSNSDAGLAMALTFLLVLFVGGVLYVSLRLGRNKYLSKLDTIFFNSFLIHKIKIFYSIEELQNLVYDKLEHITTRVANAINANQAVIDLSYKGFLKGAEGIVFTNQNSSSVTIGNMNRKGSGTVQTNVVDSAEGILIKNIQEKKANLQDVNYWYDLLQKGAISQEEYDTKKKELL